MNANSVLQFDYTPVSEMENANLGWGDGLLWLEGKPFWFCGTKQEPTPINWTWIDILEHLAICWPYLQTESPFPYDWLAEAMQEGVNFWQIADDRWEGISPSQADEEERKTLAFAQKHNLAAGWQGLAAPALYWFRQGNEVLLCPEGRPPIRVSCVESLRILEQFGEKIANGLVGTKHPRALQAFKAWHERNDISLEMRISIATGLSLDTVQAMGKENRSSSEYWGINSAANADNFNANAFLAAARMTSSFLNPDEIASVLERIRQLPALVDLPKLDKLCDQLELETPDTPHEAGYKLAAQLRINMNLSEENVFDPEIFLSELGVILKREDIGFDELEAIAVWGNKGPAILVNVRPDMRTNHEHGFRFVLAHEIAHLLVDRQQSLSAAEVLGGKTSKKVEQRADAFAAELLLPRQIAAKVYRDERNLNDAVSRLRDTYKVGRKVAKAQIKNSGNASLEDEQEIDIALKINTYYPSAHNSSSNKT